MFSKFRINRLRTVESKHSRSKAASLRQQNKSPVPVYESLEKRQLLAWDVSLSSINALNFSGPNDSANNLALSITARGFAKHNLPLSGNLVSSLDLDSSQPGEQKLLAASVQSVSVVCNNIGNIDGSSWNQAPMNITGSQFDDIIVGSSGGDYIEAKAGNDQVWGLDGDDRIFGETGNDTIYGDAGEDDLRGGAGTNFIWGGTDNDHILVVGADTVDGGSEVDTLFGTNATNYWIVFEANGGSLNGLRFEKIENIKGGISNDILTLEPVGSLSGSVDLGLGADTVEMQHLNGPLTVDKNINAWTVVGYTGLITNNERFIGNGDSQSKVSGDVFTSNWRVGTSNNFWVNRISFNNFGILESENSNDNLSGPGVETGWALIGNNSGIVQAASTYLTFNGFANLNGGVKDDLLIVYPGASLSGNFNGGAGRNAVDYSNWSTGVSVNLNTLLPGNATGVGGVLRNVAGVIGGSGNDTVIGNSSRMNLLIGNDGNDTLSGGGVRDIIFGGLGTDLISGGSGEDILVGGKTTYDNDVDAIRAILAEWTTNARNFLQRSDNIYGTGTGARLNGNYFLNNSSVIDDGVLDTISGGNGQDWFFAQPREISDFFSGGSSPDRRN